jgi:probable HAF family extracellular repeat protein
MSAIPSENAPEGTTMKTSLQTSTVLAGLLSLTVPSARMIAQEPDPTHYQVIDLGTLPHATFSQGYGINERGEIAGDGLNAEGYTHAFFWTPNNGIKDLGTLGGPNSFASAVNDRGEVALSSEVASLDPLGENFCGFGTGHICLAAIWRNGKMQPLTNLKGGDNSQAVGLNQHGQVIGFSETGVLDDI